MPIEVFIGKNREATLDGRFVAFSKRINSVLVPESFLTWANKRFGQPDSGDFYFLWKEGAIDGPPHSREQILEMKTNPVLHLGKSLHSTTPPIDLQFHRLLEFWIKRYSLPGLFLKWWTVHPLPFSNLSRIKDMNSIVNSPSRI